MAYESFAYGRLPGQKVSYMLWVLEGRSYDPTEQPGHVMHLTRVLRGPPHRDGSFDYH